MSKYLEISQDRKSKFRKPSRIHSKHVELLLRKRQKQKQTCPLFRWYVYLPKLFTIQAYLKGSSMAKPIRDSSWSQAAMQRPLENRLQHICNPRFYSLGYLVNFSLSLTLSAKWNLITNQKFFVYFNQLCWLVWLMKERIKLIYFAMKPSIGKTRSSKVRSSVLTSLGHPGS